MECRTCGEEFDADDVAEELDKILDDLDATFPTGLDLCLQCALDELFFDAEESACTLCGNPAYPDCKDGCSRI